MRHGSTVFIKIVVLLITIGSFTGMIWFPRIEGRATDLDLISIYTDPFIIYIYIASIPFFMALFQAFKLVGYAEKNKTFSPAAFNAVRNIKYCALAFSGFLVGAILFIRLITHGDDSAGPTMLGLLATLASLGVVTAATVFQKRLRIKK